MEPLPGDERFARERSEKEALSEVLKAGGKNKAEAAKIVGISKNEVYEKVKKYGLHKPAGRPLTLVLRLLRTEPQEGSDRQRASRSMIFCFSSTILSSLPIFWIFQMFSARPETVFLAFWTKNRELNLAIFRSG